MIDQALTNIKVKSLPRTARGKVRDLYEIDSDTLLFVASDRISAYDVVMANGIPSKGVLLTCISEFWFKLLPTIIPNLRTHYVSLDFPSNLLQEERMSLRNRCMQIRRLKVFPIEAIVRGYLTGSAWSEYKIHGTVHNIPMPVGLQNSEAFPQGAIYTPSTKAAEGDHDVNITPAQAAEIIGDKYARVIEDLAIKLYTSARDYAATRGIIIADTKFEFGLDEETDEIVLVDEVLTPDSSRFWDLDKYKVGQEQTSYDKQFVRNWLTDQGLRGKPDVIIPDEVVKQTTARYVEAYHKLTGRSWESIISNNYSEGKFSI
ncbi:Bgt-1055 [Blumeria graminis f. sp. tritici]|uniref:Phosphoribosylaminoimidazole-succinocarboxamide synthase n=1 Tax=Blumeria graminis f. sp. tritici TaxID=62690 RepID=A0A9X9L9H4_BLUGR|nr:Bgt-1055 [Blumeria graminis f. sp. tritici]